MRVLVTGATGYLGGHVARLLLDQGHELRALVRASSDASWLRSRDAEIVLGDLEDEHSLREACRGVESLVHCAARRGYWSRQDEVQRRINVEGTSNLLRCAHKARVGRILHVSSVAAVGCNRERAVLDEGSPWIGRRAPRLNYLYSKREAEERVLASVRQGVPCVVLNPAAMIGQRADGGAARSLFSEAVRGRVRALPPVGISICDVQDVAGAIVTALERGRIGERYILAGHNLTMLDFCREVARRVGSAPPRREYPASLGPPLAWLAGGLDALGLSRPPWAPERFRVWGWYAWMDSSKARRELGYELRPLDEMIERALAGCATR